MGVLAAICEFLAERYPEALELALWVREVMLAAEPDLSERVYNGWDGIGFPRSRCRLHLRDLPSGRRGASAV